MDNVPAIRPATPADWPAIWELLRPVFRAGDTYTVEPDICETDALAFWFAPGSRVFVAEEGGAALGTYYIRPNKDGGGAHVANCGYVTGAAAQGRGVARAMLAHSLDTARALGFRAMQYNFVVATNIRAIATWERAGFAVVGRLPGAFLHPEQGYVDALVMYRDLKGAN